MRISTRALALILLTLAACGGQIEASGGGTCPALTPGLCTPSPLCTAAGLARTGKVSCLDGAWICEETTCGTGSCDGTELPFCHQGKIDFTCCPMGAYCAEPQAYCDLGNGACVAGVSCSTLDAGVGGFDGGVDSATCDLGTIAVTAYDNSCAVDTDCTPVYDGPLCNHCFCSNAAISQSSLSSYRRDFAAANAGGNVCDCSMGPMPICRAGVCALP